MRGQTFCYVLKPNNVQKERIVIKGDPFGGGNSSQRALLCREEQLLLRFFGEGSRQLKMKWASLTLQGPECIDPTFSRSRIKRRGQREKVVSSNRMPGFWIRAYSGRFFTGRILLKNRFVSREFFIS